MLDEFDSVMELECVLVRECDTVGDGDPLLTEGESVIDSDRESLKDRVRLGEIVTEDSSDSVNEPDGE
ncbi:MAG: hypothetical protein FJ267_17510 [Planctomycetes bacterium]|nr:hypothetical protein [Planctomycetota bacterium]